MAYKVQNTQHFRNSFYSLSSQEQEEEEEIFDEILNLYTNDSELVLDNYNDNDTDILKLMPIPVSDENMIKLKNQLNKEFNIKDNIWRKLKSKINLSPKRSFYDVLTK